ncbi:MAG: hypothetical protein AAFX55_21195 [Bacteroidota bacterium]
MMQTNNNYFFKPIIIVTFFSLLLSCEVSRKEARYDSGELQFEWTEKDSLKHGELNEYYKSGKIKKIQHWENGILNGNEIVYYENGNVSHSINYYNGERVDTANFYLPSGTLIEIQYYDSSGLLKDYHKFETDGSRTKKMLLIITSHGDTVRNDALYKGRVRLGNVSDERYLQGTLIIASQWQDGLPLDTIVSISSENNNYPFEFKDHKPGENRFKACIFYQIPLDTADATLHTQRCFEQTYYVVND